MKIWMIALTVGALLGGCKSEEAKVDASSEEALRVSVAAVREALPPERRKELDAALMQIVTGSILQGVGNQLSKPGPFAPDPAAAIKSATSQLHGKTGAEVLAFSGELNKKRKERQLAAIEGEIETLSNSLEGMEAELAKARELLDGVKLERARYYWHVDRIERRPIIAFTLVNGSSTPIAKFYVEGLLETPGRSVPWVKDSFNHEVRGGIEPGESKSFTLGPNRFDAWGDEQLSTRKDLVLSLRLLAIQDANGKRVGEPSTGDLERMKSRLTDLRRQRVNLAGASE